MSHPVANLLVKGDEILNSINLHLKSESNGPDNFAVLRALNVSWLFKDADCHSHSIKDSFIALLADAKDVGLKTNLLKSKYYDHKPGIDQLDHQRKAKRSHSGGGGDTATKPLEPNGVMLSLVLTPAD